MKRTHRWGLLPGWIERRAALPWPERLLVVGPASLGDTVVTLPVLRQLRRSSPRTRVTWVAPRALEPLLQAAGVDAFLASDLPQAQAAFVPKDGDALLSFRDVEPGAYASLSDLRAFGVRIAAAHWAACARWCNHLVAVRRFGRPRHEAQRIARLLLPFGAAAPTDLGQLALDCAIEAPPPEAGLPTPPYVVLHPYSAGHAREWPVVHWQALAERLLAAGRCVVLTGSPAEAQRLAQAWPQRPSGLVDAMGQLDLRQLMALLASAEAVVAASTGPLHVAAALGRPALGLFVPRKGLSLARWAPLGLQASGVQAHRRCPSAATCTAAACRCIADLRPEAVAAWLAATGEPQAEQRAAAAFACVSRHGAGRVPARAV